jgi:hypothetical protein
MDPAFIVEVRIAMYNEQAFPPDHADGVVSVLAIFEPIVDNRDERVVKDIAR